MQEEQQKVYLAYLSRAKKEISDEIKVNGIEGSQKKNISFVNEIKANMLSP